jgi:hypothetical protein
LGQQKLVIEIGMGEGNCHSIVIQWAFNRHSIEIQSSFNGHSVVIQLPEKAKGLSLL